MRKDPGLPPALQPPDGSAQTALTRRYELITPLFGGGVRPGRHDLITPVRGTAVRGQLRFWWRATRGRFYKDIDALRTAEGLLWGAASSNAEARPSQVQIVVSEVSAGHDFVVTDNQGRKATDSRGDPISVGHFRSPYSYVAFPLQQSRGVVRDDISFTLTVTMPATWRKDKDRNDAAHFFGSPADEIAAAIWAWETFGGIGARTRRGFGALRCREAQGGGPDLPDADVLSWLAKQLARHVVSGGNRPEGVPLLSPDLRWYRAQPAQRTPLRFWNDPLEAWKQLFGRLKEFRQPRPPGTVDPRRPGRSRWPEPEAIRGLTRRRLPRHQLLPGSGKFPRAVFGLPLIFQFKDAGDPEQTSLQGVDKIDRLASPLILRPLALAKGSWVGLAAVLDAPPTPPGGLTLRQGKTQVAPSATAAAPDYILTPAEAARIKDQTGRHQLLGSSTDLLEAFLNFL